MNLIESIGGAFIFSSNPRELSLWYKENLGMTPDGEDSETGAIYKTFEHKDITIAWAILPSEKDIAGKPRTGQINYRVKNMDETLSHLKSKGVEIEKTANYDIGKFAWVRDPEGNRIELFEDLPKQP